jgi:WXG100 family type VII secretion target
MAGMFKVGFAELDKHSTDYVTCGQNLEAAFAKLRRETDELMQSVWRGEAAVAFNELLGEAELCMRRMTQRCYGMSDAIKKSNQVYQAAEADNIRAITRTRAQT